MKEYIFNQTTIGNSDSEKFSGKVNEKLMYYVAKAELANQRRGTASTKTRSMVSGGGIKPWNQKGLGRARAGSNTSPLWNGGGVVFGPRPRSFREKVNRKARRLGVESALSIRNSSIAMLRGIDLAKPSTKAVKSWLNKVKLDNVLFILEQPQEAFMLSVRNLSDCKCVRPPQMTVSDLLNYKNIIFIEGKK